MRFLEVTGPGLFAPVALSDKVVVMGRGRLPISHEVGWDGLASGRLDSQWISVRGIVRSASVAESWGRKVLFLQIHMSGGTVEARIHDFPEGETFGGLVDSEVTARGVCGTKFNDRRRLEGVRLFVPTFEYIRVDKESSLDPFALPFSSVEALSNPARFSQSDHRVRIGGTLTWKSDGLTFYLQNGAYGIRVRTLRKTHLELGSRVEAIGFPELDDQTIALEDAEARGKQPGLAVLPRRIRAVDAVQTKDGFTFAPFDAQLVQVEAKLIDSVERGATQTLLLRDGPITFQAMLGNGKGEEIAAGSLVRLTGVCAADSDSDGLPQGFAVLLRSIDDVVVLRAPWWTPARSVWLIAALIAIGAGMVFWIVKMQRGLLDESREATLREADSIKRFGWLSWILGLGGGGVGLLVLTGGWIGGLEIFKVPIPGYIAMKANTAIGLVLLGSARCLDRAGWKTPASRIVSKICCIAAISIGALTLLECLTHIDLHIDELFFRDLLFTETSGAAPGRMAAPPALNLTLLGAGLLCLGARRFVVGAQFAALFSAVSCLLNLMGYLFGARALYGIASPTAMALHTSAALLLLSASTLLARPDSGVMRNIVSQAPGGVLARRLLLPAIFIPATLGWLRWQGQLAGLYDTSFGLALYASANILGLSLLIWLTSGLLNRMDIGRSRAEESIRTLNESLEERVRQRTMELTEINDELSRTDTQLRGVLDAATPVAIVAVDQERVIRIFNKGAEAMLQYSAAEVVGVHTSDLFMEQPEIDRVVETLGSELGRPATREDLFINPALEGRTDERELTYVRKDGGRLIVNVAVTALRDDAGVVHGFLGVAKDVTTRNELERALRLNNERLAQETVRAEQANQAKSTFLAAMSHEIRTPMNAILGMAEMLSESNLDAEQRRYVEIFQRAGSNLLTLVNDILDLSKIEAGHLEFEKVEFDPERVVDEAIELIAPKAIAKKLRILSSIAPDVPRSVIGDPARVRQVLINLLGNSIKFTHEGGITVHLAPGDGGVIGFSVSDTGIGIQADKLATIFEDFAQADSSTTRQYGGTGLGLSVSRKLAERMGGSLTASSEPGKGSTFLFRARFEVSGSGASEAVAGPEDFQGKRVLILDDNPTNRLILRETVSSWGLKSAEFELPSEALKDISARASTGEGYSLVLTDNHMQEMDGFEVAAAVRLIDPRLPVVMLTSDARPGDLARRADTGVAGYAVRPVKNSDLLRLVSAALGRTQTKGAARCTSTAETESQEPQRGLRILIAEDSIDNRYVIEAYLKGSPHTLTFAFDGRSAVEQASMDTFDLILMDTRMPIMDGLSATRAIREIERVQGKPAIPILAVSANASESDIKQSLAAGCQAHICKPISKKRLLGVIRDLAPKQSPQTPALPDADELELIDETIRSMVPEYLRQRKGDLTTMPQLIEQADFENLRTIGHNMKGSGLAYGFDEISRIGAVVEAAAEEKEAEALRRSVVELARFIEAIERESEDQFSRISN